MLSNCFPKHFTVNSYIFINVGAKDLWDLQVPQEAAAPSLADSLQRQARQTIPNLSLIPNLDRYSKYNEY